MTWQEYQDGVADLYAHMDQMGRVYRNIHRPDKDTGRPRQIDLWMECDFKGVTISVLVDAKFHEEPIDVNTVEQVVMLAEAANAHMSVIVAPNGFTEGAFAKAKACKMHCRTWTLEEALEFMVEDYWTMCPLCEQDCIPMDQNGAAEWDRMWVWWLAGCCRKCHAARVWCQSCGIQMMIAAGSTEECTCGLLWEVTANGDVLPPEEVDEDEVAKTKDPHPGHPTFW